MAVLFYLDGDAALLFLPLGFLCLRGSSDLSFTFFLFFLCFCSQELPFTEN